MKPEPPVRFSHLKAYGRSALHGRHARECELMATAAMQRGTAVHALLFGTRKVIAYSGAVRRGKEYDAFVADHQDHEILTTAEYAKVTAIVKAIRDCKYAAYFLEGASEQTLFFDWYGMKCRTTPDVRGNGFVTDLKTSSSSDPSKFVWHALRMKYHAQIRFQQIGCEENGHAAAEGYIVAVESEAPFAVTVFHLEDRALIEAEKLLSLWMERLRTSEASQSWPPYCEEIVPLDIPEDDIELNYGEDNDQD